MKKEKLNIAFFGSSIVSAYWNGAATYYRGIIKALSQKGYKITFYEPNIYNRQKHRDIDPPDYCEVIIYEDDKINLQTLLRKAQEEADIIIKASGVGAFDEFLEEEIPKLKTAENVILFWDVDAPATLNRMKNDLQDSFRNQVRKYDCILTYGGGDPVIDVYLKLGAKRCVPIYNALDVETHFPVESENKFESFLSFLGNRLPDREQRVLEFFIKPAGDFSDKKFLLGGSGWEDLEKPENVEYINHVFTKDHNAFNSSALAVLNISRESMAEYGFSPATRVFEAAGSAACMITDYWEGIEMFFEPNQEILIAKDGEEVIKILENLTVEKAKKIGEAAHKKVLEKHTYKNRVKLFDNAIKEILKENKPKIETS